MHHQMFGGARILKCKQGREHPKSALPRFGNLALLNTFWIFIKKSRGIGCIGSEIVGAVSVPR